MEVSQKIAGPYLISGYYHTETKRYVYLLSDIHVRRPCPQDYVAVSDFIDTLIKSNSDLTVDVMIETHERDGKSKWKKKQKNKISYLTEAVLKLEDCYNAIKKCDYDNARVHWVDVRYHPLFDSLMETFKAAAGFADQPRAIMLLMYPDIEVRLIKKFETEFKNFEDHDSIFKQLKISKQIESIQGELRHKFERLAKEKIRNAHLKTLKIYGYKDFDRTYMATLKFMSVYTDIYTVARLLRSFSNGPDLQNAVIYMGGAHIREIKLMLNKLGFKLFAQVGRDSKGALSPGLYHNDSVQCVDLQGFPKFFTHGDIQAQTTREIHEERILEALTSSSWYNIDARRVISDLELKDLISEGLKLDNISSNPEMYPLFSPTHLKTALESLF